MGYEYYILNETKKQIFGGFKLGEGTYEAQSYVLAYLSICNRDTFRFAGETDKVVEENVFGNEDNKVKGDYRFISPWDYRLHYVYGDNDNPGRLSEEIERLKQDVCQIV